MGLWINLNIGQDKDNCQSWSTTEIYFFNMEGNGVCSVMDMMYSTTDWIIIRLIATLNEGCDPMASPDTTVFQLQVTNRP